MSWTDNDDSGWARATQQPKTAESTPTPTTSWGERGRAVTAATPASTTSSAWDTTGSSSAAPRTGGTDDNDNNGSPFVYSSPLSPSPSSTSNRESRSPVFSRWAPPGNIPEPPKYPPKLRTTKSASASTASSAGDAGTAAESEGTARRIINSPELTMSPLPSASASESTSTVSAAPQDATAPPRTAAVAAASPTGKDTLGGDLIVENPDCNSCTNLKNRLQQAILEIIQLEDANESLQAQAQAQAQAQSQTARSDLPATARQEHVDHSVHVAQIRRLETRLDEVQQELKLQKDVSMRLSESLTAASAELAQREAELATRETQTDAVRELERQVARLERDVMAVREDKIRAEAQVKSVEEILDDVKAEKMAAERRNGEYDKILDELVQMANGEGTASGQGGAGLSRSPSTSSSSTAASTESAGRRYTIADMMNLAPPEALASGAAGEEAGATGPWKRTPSAANIRDEHDRRRRDLIGDAISELNSSIAYQAHSHSTRTRQLEGRIQELERDKRNLTTSLGLLLKNFERVDSRAKKSEEPEERRGLVALSREGDAEGGDEGGTGHLTPRAKEPVVFHPQATTTTRDDDSHTEAIQRLARGTVLGLQQQQQQQQQSTSAGTDQQQPPLSPIAPEHQEGVRELERATVAVAAAAVTSDTGIQSEMEKHGSEVEGESKKGEAEQNEEKKREDGGWNECEGVEGAAAAAKGLQSEEQKSSSDPDQPKTPQEMAKLASFADVFAYAKSTYAKSNEPASSTSASASPSTSPSSILRLNTPPHPTVTSPTAAGTSASSSSAQSPEREYEIVNTRLQPDTPTVGQEEEEL